MKTELKLFEATNDVSLSQLHLLRAFQAKFKTSKKYFNKLLVPNNNGKYNDGFTFSMIYWDTLDFSQN